MDPFETAKLTGLFIGAYLFGSVPFGLVFAKKFASIDIRKEGSGNIGATNVRRVAGAKLGALTLAGDLLKGIIPVYIAGIIADNGITIVQIYISAVAAAAFFGHLYPVYLKFKGGGKGVATAAGSFLVISPWALLAAVAAFVIFVFMSKRVSAGSLAAAAVLPVAIWFTGNSVYYIFCAVIIAVLIFIRHKDNIKRLISRTEPEI